MFFPVVVTTSEFRAWRIGRRYLDCTCDKDIVTTRSLLADLKSPSSPSRECELPGKTCLREMSHICGQILWAHQYAKCRYVLFIKVTCLAMLKKKVCSFLLCRSVERYSALIRNIHNRFQWPLRVKAKWF